MKYSLFALLFVGHTAFAQWTQLFPSSSPPARAFHCSAFDPVNGKFIIHGGLGSGGLLGDTWIYDPGTNAWTQLTSAGGPGIHDCAMTFVKKNSLGQNVNRVLLLMGTANPISCIGTCNVDWGFTIDLSAATPRWAQVNHFSSIGSILPKARKGAGLTYSESKGKVYLMGGNGQGPLGNFGYGDPQGTELFEGDLNISGTSINWKRNFTSFTGAQPDHLDDPILQWIPSASDPDGLLILSGGRQATTGAGFKPETLVWDGSFQGSRIDWRLASSVNPNMAVSVGFDYDARRGWLTTVGGWQGGPVTDETYIWVPDQDRWRPRSFPSLGKPSARQWAEMAHNPIDGKNYFFGGQDAGGALLNETWVYDIQEGASQIIGTACNGFSGNQTVLTDDPAAFGLHGPNKIKNGFDYNLRTEVPNNANPGGLGVLLLGFNPANLPVLGCTIHSSADLTLPFALDANSRFDLNIAIRFLPLGAIGNKYYWQAVLVTPTGIATSTGLETTQGF